MEPRVSLQKPPGEYCLGNDAILKRINGAWLSFEDQIRADLLLTRPTQPNKNELIWRTAFKGLTLNSDDHVIRAQLGLVSNGAESSQLHQLASSSCSDLMESVIKAQSQYPHLDSWSGASDCFTISAYVNSRVMNSGQNHESSLIGLISARKSDYVELQLISLRSRRRITLTNVQNYNVLGLSWCRTLDGERQRRERPREVMLHWAHLGPDSTFFFLHRGMKTRNEDDTEAGWSRRGGGHVQMACLDTLDM